MAHRDLICLGQVTTMLSFALIQVPVTEPVERSRPHIVLYEILISLLAAPSRNLMWNAFS